MAVADVKDVVFAVSAGGFFCVYPLVVVVWLLRDFRAASPNRDPLQHRCRRRVGKASTEETSDDKDDCSKPLSRGAALQRLRTAFAPTAASAVAAVLCRAVEVAIAVGLVFAYAFRLIAYATVLLPWFLQWVYRWMRSPHLHCGIRYGPKPRNYLDLYLPDEATEAVRAGGKKAPVLVVAMGGAWIIGHKVWNGQLGLRLLPAGVLVVAVDYRNYPFAKFDDMVEDLECALDWIFANIASWGGDPDNVVLMGQSAGAHLEALLLVRRAMREARAEEAARARRPDSASSGDARPTWSVRDLKGWAGVSGVYDLVTLRSHLCGRGMYDLLPTLCGDGGAGDLPVYSPLRILESAEWAASGAAALLPPVRLLHGEADATVPVASSVRLAEALRRTGNPVHVELHAGVTHSEPVVEDPFKGGDLQAYLIMPFFGPDFVARLAALPAPKPQPPQFIMSLAGCLMPF